LTKQGKLQPFNCTVEPIIWSTSLWPKISGKNQVHGVQWVSFQTSKCHHLQRREKTVHAHVHVWDDSKGRTAWNYHLILMKLLEGLVKCHQC
jgi:hypothetical protein